ncbi:MULTISPECIES: CTB family bacteriocin [unclassified Nodularia (in: cyanobacteria)]|uniref:CTB family bacteriocin n=1 Tax=unclassified Nodularia (in: cyanobacteria) TaxID=2656917 RepID=UPI0018829C67|nr:MULTISPECIES: CTB family bacteriocin [unclassified Nodularia (in: cyanobacteria)]MBE9200590.1 CTB family bacteriocin [Nodularia sp. LEGE 06071]MCC2692506.1 CTB family bacteriocin [Nodularia sp. LEGE 04288]
MLNPLFTEVSSEQQEAVVGGFTFNFGNTFFTGSQENTSTTTTSTPDGGSTTTSTTGNVQINTTGLTFNGFNLPANFLSGGVTP